MQWIMARLIRVARVLRGGSIHFDHVVAVGGGGVHVLSSAGMTSITDAGAAGRVPLFYDSANNRIGIGTIVPAAPIHLSSDGLTRVANTSSGLSMDLTGGTYLIDAGAAFSVDYLGKGLMSGWLLVKGVCGEDRSDFINPDWGAAGVAGVKWLTSDVIPPAAVAARGGVYRKSTNSVTPSFWKGQQTVYSAQDAYRVYARYAMQQIVNCRFAVGVCDDVPAAAPNSLPYTNDGILCVQDDAVGPNHLLRQVVAAAVVDDDSGVAVVAGEFHQIDILVATTRIPTLYIDGTLRATGAAADSPLAATLLRKVVYADNIGAAVLAQLDIDVYDIVESRNTAVTP